MNTLERIGRIHGLAQEMKQAHDERDFVKVSDLAEKVKYHTNIIMEVSNELASLRPAKSRSRQEKIDGRTHPRSGEMSRYIRHHLKDVKPGDVVTVPFGPHDPSRLHSAVSGVASYDWGNGSYMSRKGENGVEVFRHK